MTTPDETAGPGGRRNLLENRIPPPIVALLVGAGMAVAGRWLPPAVIAVPWRIGLGAAALVLAVRFGSGAFLAFTRARTTINPVVIDGASALVTEGPYARSRNPMYVALTAVLVALALGLGNGWLLAGPALFALYIDRFQIVPEERAMAARFGEAYADYCRRVRRWL